MFWEKQNHRCSILSKPVTRDSNWCLSSDSCLLELLSSEITFTSQNNDTKSVYIIGKATDILQNMLCKAQKVSPSSKFGPLQICIYNKLFRRKPKSTKKGQQFISHGTFLGLSYISYCPSSKNPFSTLTKNSSPWGKNVYRKIHKTSLVYSLTEVQD